MNFNELFLAVFSSGIQFLKQILLLKQIKCVAFKTPGANVILFPKIHFTGIIMLVESTKFNHFYFLTLKRYFYGWHISVFQSLNFKL